MPPDVARLSGLRPGNVYPCGQGAEPLPDRSVPSSCPVERHRRPTNPEPLHNMAIFVGTLVTGFARDMLAVAGISAHRRAGRRSRGSNPHTADVV